MPIYTCYPSANLQIYMYKLGPYLSPIKIYNSNYNLKGSLPRNIFNHTYNYIFGLYEEGAVSLDLIKLYEGHRHKNFSPYTYIFASLFVAYI